MPKGPFRPSQFTATQWSTQQDKADFANSLLHFIDSGFKQTLFTKKLYNRLSMTYGHIAHYNQTGFWGEWFTEDADKVRFLEHLLRWPGYGDPAFTFSDVEQATQKELERRNTLSRYQSIANATLRAREVAILERLEAKYRHPSLTEPIPFREHIDSVPSLPVQPEEPIQGVLF